MMWIIFGLTLMFLPFLGLVLKLLEVTGVIAPAPVRPARPKSNFQLICNLVADRVAMVVGYALLAAIVCVVAVAIGPVGIAIGIAAAYVIWIIERKRQ